jgi:hypothetical protein
MLLSSASGPRLHGRLSSNVRPQVNWFIAIGTAAVGVLIIVAVFQLPFLPALSRKTEAAFRAQNARLVAQRFGTSGPASKAPWHKVLHSEERRIVWAGQGALIGLKQVLLIEDHCQSHWRVVVAHQLGRKPVFEATALASVG